MFDSIKAHVKTHFAVGEYFLECKHIINFIESTIPSDDTIEEAFERKKLKYAELVVEVRERGWQAHTRPVEI